MRKFVNTLWVLSFAALLLAVSAWAGTTGKIAGVVTDKTNGQPIPGAAISIVGTTWGALTDEEGRFVILNVPVGTYTLKATIVGFAPMEVTNVGVNVDLTTIQDFALSSEAVELGTVSVTAERPLVKQDRTSSLRIVGAEDVQNLPTRGYQDVVGLQAGAIRFSDNVGVRQRGGRENSTTGTLNVRGGRSSEVAYYVDGFSQQDPLTGLSTTQINNNSIQEVSIVTGGFNAEYGLIMSGAVNVITRAGTDKFHGTFETVTDNFHGENYDFNVYSGVLSGPITPGSDKLTFYVAGERRWAGDREPHATAGGMLPNNESGLWNWQGKLNWRPSGNVSALVGTNGSVEKWQEYRHDYLFNIQHTPKYDDRNYSVFGELTHTVNSKTFHTLKANWFSTERIRGDGVHFDDLWAYGRPSGNPNFDQTQLYTAWDDMNLDPDSLEHGSEENKYFPLVTPHEDSVFEVLMPDGSTREQSFVVRGDEATVWDDLLKRKSSYVGADWDLVSQVHPNHEVKAGLEFQRHALRRYQHLFPVNVYQGANGGFDDIDHFGYNELGEESDEGGLNSVKNPINMAAYLQDKFEWEGLVVNAGLRFDYFDYKTERLVDPEQPLDPFDRATYADTATGLSDEERNALRQGAQELSEDELTSSESVSRLSPRLGVAFPVADGSVFHFSYGKFFQRPDLQNLYVNYDYLEYKIRTGGYFFAFGNPNLEPEETTAYEAGWQRRVSDNASIDITAFYKDVKNLTEVVTQPAIPNSFSTYRNVDYGTVKGVEFSLDVRRSRNISAQFNYALAYADGTGSFANTQSNIAWTVAEPPKHATPLEFDQRHKITGVLDIRTGPGEGPKLGDFYPLERAGVNFVLGAGSGFPYSPVFVYNEVTLGAISPRPSGPINSRRQPWQYRVDMKANREITIAGKMNLDLYVWVINLFDRDNVVDVYESTGLPNETGWLETPDGQQFIVDNSMIHDTSRLTGEEKYQVRQADPRNYDTPRQIRFGARWTF
ncbi:MAG TPA: TonB-dependent receptor [bacterium]|nr:TonB-dependent receptor [bacterium]